MKKLLIVLVAFLFAFLLLTFKTSDGTYLLSHSYCSQPITYRLGSVDARFNLTNEQLMTDIEQAATIWNTIINKEVFAYDPQGKVTINFVYDRRQELSNQVSQLETQLDTNKDSLDPKIAEYEKRANAFEQKLAALNTEIRYWNERGGAPPDEYQKLQNEQANLQQEADSLNEEARSLNQSTRLYNAQVRDLNQTVTQLKQSLDERPEEGVYDGATETITIYLNNTRAERIHTLAHELGHARGIGHFNDADALMYPNSTEAIIPTEVDIKAIEEICRERSYPEIIIERYATTLHHLAIRLNSKDN